MSELKKYYDKYCYKGSDINEHLPVLREYASECNHITEMGVREGISTWAFLMGSPKKMISYDIREDTFINKYKVEKAAEDNGIDYLFVEADSLKIDIEPTDLLFLDTYHAYGQLIRELRKHSSKVGKYIILHDTVSFGHRDMTSKYKISDFDDDGKHGLMMAVEDFISDNEDWEIKEHHTNNNGLLIMSRKQKGLKVISFSLWGSKPFYWKGALENIRLAKEIYPDWVCRFYVDNTVEEKIWQKIKDEGGEVIMVNNSLGSFHGMFWRFLPNDDPDVEVFISRDCDSRLNVREKACVDEWLGSDKGFHCMHDHPYHKCVPILGGMWGAKHGCISDMEGKIRDWNKYHCKGIDQTFLLKVIWPLVKNDCIRHDSVHVRRWGKARPFPKHEPLRFGGKYVGQMFNGNNKAVQPSPGVD